jgi:uncharacterized protein (UPF0333 family)
MCLRLFKENIKVGIFKDQRGIAHIAIILVVLVLAAAGGGYYYVSKANKKTNVLQTTEQKATNEACMKVVNDEDQCAYFAANTGDFGNYTMVMTGSNAGESFNWTMADDGKDNTSVKMSGGGFEMETVTLNGDVYSKMAGANSWTKYPKTESADATEESDTPFSDDDFKFDYNKDKMTSAGKEQCGELTCFKYTYTGSETVDDETVNYTWTIWFDDKDYKTRKAVGTGADGSNFEMVFTYGGVTISEPSPVSSI